MQNGEIVAQDPKAHAQVLLKFLPLEDGISFKLQGTFLDTVPEGRPRVGADNRKAPPSVILPPPVRSPSAASAVLSFRPVLIPGPSIFIEWVQITRNARTIYGCSPGIPAMRSFVPAVQQSQLRFPLRNTEGADQTITFPKIGDQRTGSQPLKLQATSSSGEPVSLLRPRGSSRNQGRHAFVYPHSRKSQIPGKGHGRGLAMGKVDRSQAQNSCPRGTDFLIAK